MREVTFTLVASRAQVTAMEQLATLMEMILMMTSTAIIMNIAMTMTTDIATATTIIMTIIMPMTMITITITTTTTIMAAMPSNVWVATFLPHLQWLTRRT